MILVLFYSFTLFLKCSCTTAPEEEKGLVISKGYYKSSLLEQSWKYEISFDYYIMGTNGYISGYSITVNDSLAGSVFWDNVKKIVPGEIYTINDVINTPIHWETDPLVSIQVSVTGSGNQLNAEYRLQPIE